MWCFQRPLRWRLPDFLFESPSCRIIMACTWEE